MQLKTCTNPDRIMKYRHKILHSMEIAFSHVLWFEKKRENDSETDGDTQGEEKERGKRKETEMQGESAAARWSPTELGEEERSFMPWPPLPADGRSLGFSGCYLGKKEVRRPPPPSP